MLDACVIWATSHEVGQALRSKHHCGYDCFVLTCSEIEVTKGDDKKNCLKDGDYAFLTKNVRMTTKFLSLKRTMFNIPKSRNKH